MLSSVSSQHSFSLISIMSCLPYRCVVGLLWFYPIKKWDQSLRCSFWHSVYCSLSSALIPAQLNPKWWYPIWFLLPVCATLCPYGNGNRRVGKCWLRSWIVGRRMLRQWHLKAPHWDSHGVDQTYKKSQSVKGRKKRLLGSNVSVPDTVSDKD